MYIKFISFIILIFALSACSDNNLNVIGDDQQAEVLVAQDCGFDKLKCCLDQPVCKYGQKCCQDPNNPEKNYCADDCSCGGLDEFCCENTKCQKDLDCYNGKCIECGDVGQICCGKGKTCNDSLICHGNECTECGIEGNPCCESGKSCILEDEINKNRTECVNNKCERCGSSGSHACLAEPKCLKGNLYSNNYCFQCGGVNQPCCVDNEGNKTHYKCDQSRGLNCISGFCSK